MFNSAPNYARVAGSFCVMFCRLLFVFFLFTMVLSVLLRFTDSDYPFGIFKFFLYQTWKKNDHVYVLGVLNVVPTIFRFTFVTIPTWFCLPILEYYGTFIVMCFS
jgi:ABC-type phosphate transport system permease subunit